MIARIGVGGDKLVVVDVELCSWVGGLGCFECNFDEILTQKVGEYISTEASLLIEHFVYDVLERSETAIRALVGYTYPLQDLPRISSNLFCYVILDHGCESIFGSDGGNPTGQLRVPDSGVATNVLVVGCSPVY